VAQAAIDVVSPGAAAKKIAIETSFAENVPPVNGDSERLQQVVWNLLSNALKFTDAGGRVCVEVAAEGANVRLSVRDNGQGVSPEFIPYVFDRFRQADASTSRRHGGLGLGLSLVRQIVELHGGKVSVESAGVMKGSTFCVSLPAAAGADRRLPVHPVSSEPVTLDGISILIVDDETDARELLVAMLENFGASVRAIGSADEAIDLLKRGDLSPDVLVSDVGMPDTDGFALIRSIRALDSPKTRSMPAIAVTAYANPEDRVRALVAGYQNHIPKPVDPNALAAAIVRLVTA
jgi:CheY-like chemotaxis protein/anti-sigma regulatory factor (Ser/Thr protein kinase)